MQPSRVTALKSAGQGCTTATRDILAASRPPTSVTCRPTSGRGTEKAVKGMLPKARSGYAGMIKKPQGMAAQSTLHSAQQPKCWKSREP